MRVTFVTELGGRPDEGMRIVGRDIVRGLRAAGHEVIELAPRGDARWSALNPVFSWRVRRSGADALVYLPYSGLTPKALLRLAVIGALSPSTQTAIAVVQADGTMQHRRPRRRPDAALFVSERLRRNHGLLADIEAVISPAIDRDRFRPVETPKAALRRELGLPESGALILHVGHIRTSRNLEVLAKLAAQPGVSVVLVASTSTEPEQHIHEMLERAGVTIIRRFLPAIERVYQAADVYVFPVTDPRGSIEVPLSVLEARACGLPTVSTAFGALPDLLRDDTGTVFASPDEFGKNVTRLAGADAPPPRVLDELTTHAIARTLTAALRPRQRRAATIAISGVDGAGKSTQLERLAQRLGAQGYDVETLWCRWDPWLAKPAVKLLDRLSRGGRGGSRPEDSPGDATATAVRRRKLRKQLLGNPLVRTLWRSLIVLDYAVRIAPAVRRARRRRSVLLLDRYWHDVLVDLSFGGDLGSLPWPAERLLPAPDHLVLLDVDEATAHGRKPESADPLYLSERRRLYRLVADRYGAAVIDASRDVQSVSEDLGRVVDEFLRLTDAARKAE